MSALNSEESIHMSIGDQNRSVGFSASGQSLAILPQPPQTQNPSWAPHCLSMKHEEVFCLGLEDESPATVQTEVPTNQDSTWLPYAENLFASSQLL